MNPKRILLSIATIAVLGGLVAGGTVAYYNDTETSRGNIFTAGSVDLRVDHTKQTYNGLDCESCSVQVYSGTHTVVDGANEPAANNGGFPRPAVEVADPHPNWQDEDELAPAQWIWEASSTDPRDTTNDAKYKFSNYFDWDGPVADVDLDLALAADNGYRIFLNGHTIVDKLDEEHNFENAISLTEAEEAAFASALVDGENHLRISVQNHAGSQDPAANPAGLLFNLTIERDGCEDFRNICQLWGEKDLDGSETFFNFGDIKPGDHGSNIISLHVGDNDSYACLIAHDGDAAENTLLDPETDLGDAGNPGELQNYINVFAWIDTNQDNEYGSGDTDLGTATLGDLDSIVDLDTDEHFLTATTTEYIGIEWCAGDIANVDGEITCDGAGMANDAQSDSFSANLTAYAVQKRHNDEFSCDDVELDEQD